MKANKKRTGLAVLMAAGLFLAGCGGSAKGGSVSTETAYNASYESKPEMAAADSVIEYEGIGNDTFEPADTEVTTEKLVYRGSLDIQTKEYETSVQQLRKLVSEYGGLIESENEYEEGSYYAGNELKKLWNLYMCVRIPSEKYQEFMNGSQVIGNVISRSSSAENISRRYNDVSIQIEALEKQQTRLLEMMDAANTIEDMIAVESRLSDVQYQLNSLKTSRESMDTDVAYSTVNITLREVRVYAEVNDSFLSRLTNRLTGGFESFIEKCGELVLAIVWILPYLLVAALIIFILKKSGKIPGFKWPSFRRKSKLDQ